MSDSTRFDALGNSVASPQTHWSHHRQIQGRLSGLLAVAFATSAMFIWAVPGAGAATTDVNLGTTSSYAVLAGSTIVNTGPSVLSGDVGLSPGTSVIGFPPARSPRARPTSRMDPRRTPKMTSPRRTSMPRRARPLRRCRRT